MINSWKYASVEPTIPGISLYNKLICCEFPTYVDKWLACNVTPSCHCLLINITSEIDLGMCHLSSMMTVRACQRRTYEQIFLSSLYSQLGHESPFVAKITLCKVNVSWTKASMVEVVVEWWWCVCVWEREREEGWGEADSIMSYCGCCSIESEENWTLLPLYPGMV